MNKTDVHKRHFFWIVAILNNVQILGLKLANFNNESMDVKC